MNTSKLSPLYLLLGMLILMSIFSFPVQAQSAQPRGEKPNGQFAKPPTHTKKARSTTRKTATPSKHRDKGTWRTEYISSDIVDICIPPYRNEYDDYTHFYIRCAHHFCDLFGNAHAPGDEYRRCSADEDRRRFFPDLDISCSYLFSHTDQFWSANSHSHIHSQRIRTYRHRSRVIDYSTGRSFVNHRDSLTYADHRADSSRSPGNPDYCASTTMVYLGCLNYRQRNSSHPVLSFV
jgi:hypothetical protein